MKEGAKFAQATKILNDSSTKNSAIDAFIFLNFVLFATFVVKCLFRFWLHLCCAVSSLVITPQR
jgi:hypothetical protein